MCLMRQKYHNTNVIFSFLNIQNLKRNIFVKRSVIVIYFETQRAAIEQRVHRPPLFYLILRNLNTHTYIFIIIT